LEKEADVRPDSNPFGCLFSDRYLGRMALPVLHGMHCPVKALAQPKVSKATTFHLPDFILPPTLHEQQPQEHRITAQADKILGPFVVKTRLAILNALQPCCVWQRFMSVTSVWHVRRILGNHWATADNAPKHCFIHPLRKVRPPQPSFDVPIRNRILERIHS
jgi:hypothetical protein